MRRVVLVSMFTCSSPGAPLAARGTTVTRKPHSSGISWVVQAARVGAGVLPQATTRAQSRSAARAAGSASPSARNARRRAAVTRARSAHRSGTVWA
ncbi:MAG: hypothetical protein IPL19_26385 [Sandaracinaceae bacterium]|nr:hypothetical protein [Sandaracinaceae bacterium]